MKRFGSLCVATMMASSMLLTPTYAVEFSDLPETHWAYEDIMKLVEDGVVNGYTDGTYQPGKEVTRGEFLKLILTAFYGEEYFADMDFYLQHWADKYALVAVSEEYLMDGTTAANLNNLISRKEMVHIIAKICLKNNVESGGSHSAVAFSDVEELDDTTKLYIDFVSLNGLIRGYTDGTFKPDNNMTRAEVATVINRFMKMLEPIIVE